MGRFAEAKLRIIVSGAAGFIGSHLTDRLLKDRHIVIGLDNLITGSVHTIEYIELFYWLKRLNYQGYLSIDQYPYRENALEAAQESLNWMRCFEKAASRIDDAALQQILSRQDAVASTRYIRSLLFD